MDHVVSPIKPSPHTTLAILLGASKWPHSSIPSSPAFRRSANKVRDYFCNPRLFGLSPENWLDLFDQHQDNPNDVDQAIGNFLDQRISSLKKAGIPARDLLFYYIGHGVFASDSEQAYHLAIQSTRDDNIGASAITMASLAHTLKEKARYLRRIVILDCCFAAKSLKYMQSAPDQVALQQTESAFEEKSKGSGFPIKGTALLCSSGHKNPSFFLQDESGTMFSEAFIRALSVENMHQPDKGHLSLYDLKQPIMDILGILAGKNAPRPEIHSPDQSDGDVASVPFFPNPSSEEERVRRVAQAEQIRLAEEDVPRKAAQDARAIWTEDVPRKTAQADQVHLAEDELRKSTQAASTIWGEEDVPRKAAQARLAEKDVPRKAVQAEWTIGAEDKSRKAEEDERVRKAAQAVQAIWAEEDEPRKAAQANPQPIILQSIDATPITQTSTHDKRQFYTVLDIGTVYAKAMIIEVQDDIGVVLGVGRHQHNYGHHISDGIVTDISAVIVNCRKALQQAEQSAGRRIAPNTVIGITGERVKGSSITMSAQRAHPTKPIHPEELESIVISAQQKLLKTAKEQIAAETGYPNIEVRLTNTAVISVGIDAQAVSNPIGFCGRYFNLSLFSAFAPLMQLGALETVAQGLELTPAIIVAEPFALARCLGRNASADSGAILIDIGGDITGIALVRQGRIEKTRMFALGGRTFTRRLAAYKGLSLEDAEKLKVKYSQGAIKGAEKNEIQQIFASEMQTWMDSVELLVEELAQGELLPPAVYMVGGGSGLPDLIEKLENFPWTARLPFLQPPIVQTIQPGMVSSIADPNHLLKNAQDITPMALAYQAVEIQNDDNALERILRQVIHSMHI